MRRLIASYTRKDFRVDTFCSGGPGGQHQNKTQSGVRITHMATGLVAESRESKSQLQNRHIAFRRLAEQLKRWHEVQAQQERPRVTHVVRTYNEPDNRVVDHGSGLRQPFQVVLDDPSRMIESRT